MKIYYYSLMFMLVWSITNITSAMVHETDWELFEHTQKNLIFDPADQPDDADSTPLINKRHKKNQQKNGSKHADQKKSEDADKDKQEKNIELSLLQCFGIGFGCTLLVWLVHNLLFKQSSDKLSAESY